jgi:proline racemase
MGGFLKSSNVLSIVDTHTEGEPTRIILSGFPNLKGDTIYDKRKFMQERFDHLRTSTLLEPRGHDNQFGALILHTDSSNADYGLIFMDNRGYLDMCGHGTIGVTTALIELGMVEPTEPYTEIAYETVAGFVNVKALIKDGSVIEVHLIDVPSFYLGAFEVKMGGGESIPVDVAYGGNFYVITDADNLNTRVRIGHIDELIRKGITLRDEAARQIQVHHPNAPNIPQKIGLAMMTDEPELQQSDGKNVVIFGDGQFDRSPCGTGTAARLSTLYSRGLYGVGETFIHESIINTSFRAKVLETTRVGPYDAIVPEITGRAFITQIAHIIINPDDPLKNGFSTKRHISNSSNSII